MKKVEKWNRVEIMSRFGAKMLFALFSLLIDHLNEHRKKDGLEEFSEDEIAYKIGKKYEEITDYPWMGQD